MKSVVGHGERIRKCPKEAKDDPTAFLLPEHILFEILSRLPPKSLLRYKCVSKSFRALVVDPHFVDVRRDRSLTHPGCQPTIIVSFYCYHNGCSYFSYMLEESQGNFQVNPRLKYFDGKFVKSSFNGLICLSNRCDMKIYNPTTRQCISPPTMPYISTSSIHFPRLGFDQVSETYKVLLSIRTATKVNHWVLTLGVDKSWREIDCPRYSYLVSSHVHINGVIYSTNVALNQPHDLSISAFDVATETFSFIPFVVEGVDLSRFVTSMVEVESRPALVCMDPTYISSTIDIWTLEESMEWKKKVRVTVPVTDEMISFVSTGSPNKLLVLVQGRRGFRLSHYSILYYEFGTRVWRRYQICGLDGFIYGGIVSSTSIACNAVQISEDFTFLSSTSWINVKDPS